MKQSEMIRELVESVAECLCGEFNLTEDNVPRIIFKGSKHKISVVYLARSQHWKAFYPFPSNEQKKEYFGTMRDLISWLFDQGVEL